MANNTKQPEEGLPYDGHTVYTVHTCTGEQHVYCLQPAACVENTAHECGECHDALTKKKVPDHSLVRYDTGSLPPGLVPLTMIEERLLSRYRVARYCYYIKPVDKKKWNGLPSQYCHRAHDVAFPNVDNEMLLGTLLRSPKTLSEDMQVRIAEVMK